MKEILLTQGKVALVDDEDFDRINKYKWYAAKSCNTFYAQSNIPVGYKKQKTVKMHRLILGLTDSNILGDHIDHDGLNNQKYNLRLATKKQNTQNRTSKKNSLSKYLGVTRYRNKWVAKIAKDKKNIHLGYFEREEDAALSYNRAAIRIRGEFASLNIITFLTCILLVSATLFSCTKENKDLEPIVRSVTYLRHLYNDNGQYLGTDTSIHWCKVGGEDLKSYEAKGSGEITFCGTYNRLELVIGEACKKFD